MKRLSVREAAAYSGRHEVTLRKALEAGELHGGQRVRGGRWSIRTECIDAWLDGVDCDHQARPGKPSHLRTARSAS